MFAGVRCRTTRLRFDKCARPASGRAATGGDPVRGRPGTRPAARGPMIWDVNADEVDEQSGEVRCGRYVAGPDREAVHANIDERRRHACPITVIGPVTCGSTERATQPLGGGPPATEDWKAETAAEELARKPFPNRRL